MPSLAQEELEGPRGPQGARQAQQDRRRGFALPLRRHIRRRRRSGDDSREWPRPADL